MGTAHARIEELADELAALSPEDRTRVLVAVGDRASKMARDIIRPMSWQRLHELEGMVNLGGSSLEDCSRLYDG